MILSIEENRRSLEVERLQIASHVGEIMAEAMSLAPDTYVVEYRPGVKMDYCFHLHPEKPRPDKALIDIVYDPKRPSRGAGGQVQREDLGDRRR
jgi:hypothetical protein